MPTGLVLQSSEVVEKIHFLIKLSQQLCSSRVSVWTCSYFCSIWDFFFFFFVSLSSMLSALCLRHAVLGMIVTLLPQVSSETHWRSAVTYASVLRQPAQDVLVRRVTQTAVFCCSLVLCPSLASFSEEGKCLLTKMTSKTSIDWRVPVPPIRCS